MNDYRPPTPSKKPEHTDHFLLIQVWRALAALLVTTGHVAQEASSIAGMKGLSFNGWIYPTGVGVDLFFVISGFVIIYATRRDIGRPERRNTFLLRRFIRVAPLYWLYTTLMILAAALIAGAADNATLDPGQIIASYLFIPYESAAGHVRPVLSLGWSLNYEIYFYTVCGILLFLPARHVLRALVTWFVVTAILGVFVIPDEFTALSFWCAPYVLEFLAGSLIGFAAMRGFVLPGYCRAILSAAGLAVLMCLFALPGTGPDLYVPLRTLAGGLAGSLLVCAACLPYGSRDFRPPAVLVALGNSSYSLYLAHPFIIGVLKLLALRFLSFNPVVFILLALPACLAGGHVLYLVIEKPLLRFLQVKLLKQPANSQTPKVA